MLKCQQSQRTLEQIALGGDRPHWLCPRPWFHLSSGTCVVYDWRSEQKAGVSLGMSEPFCPPPPPVSESGQIDTIRC